MNPAPRSLQSRREACRERGSTKHVPIAWHAGGKTAQAMQKPYYAMSQTCCGEITLPRRRMELLISLVKFELDKVVLRETRTGMRVTAGR